MTGVSRMRFAEFEPKRLLGRWDHDQVHVIGRQAIGTDINASLGTSLPRSDAEVVDPQGAALEAEDAVDRDADLVGMGLEALLVSCPI